jgi:hypothetical protein
VLFRDGDGVPGTHKAAAVNVANGNLVLQMPDGQLSGRGTDLVALRTHNSLGAPTDGDGDGWRWGYEQAVRYQGPRAPHQPGSGATAIRAEGEGHETFYNWDAAQASFSRPPAVVRMIDSGTTTPRPSGCGPMVRPG